MNESINQLCWYSINAKMFNAGFVRRNGLGTPVKQLSRLSVLTLICSNKEILGTEFGRNYRFKWESGLY